MRASTVLKRAVMERRAVVAPECYDAFSARIIEKCGVEAIQVSGFGLAGSLLGRPDVGLVQMKDILDLTWNIAQAVKIPVMADIDTGSGNAINTAATVERLIAMGVGRVSIPVASIMVVHKALMSFFTALKASPTGTLSGQTQWMTTFEEYTDSVGLREYRALEGEFLPSASLDTKYKGSVKMV